MYKFRNPKNGQVYSLPKTQENYDGAVAKGYEPVEEVFDPKTSKSFVIPSSQLETAKGKGYVTQDGLNTIDKKSDPKEYGSLETAAYGGVQGVTFDFGDEIGGFLGAIKDKYIDGDKGDFSDHYKTNRDSLRQRFRDAEEQNPAAYIAGDVVGSVAPALASGGASLLASGGKVAAKQAIKQTGKQLAKRAFAESAVAGAGASEDDSLVGNLKDAAIAGTVGAATGPVAKFLGKNAKKIIPAHKEAFKTVNDVTAWLASKLPHQNASSKELSDFLSHPKTRMAARNAEPLDLAEGVVPKLQQFKDELGDKVSESYRRLEDDAILDAGWDNNALYKGVEAKLSRLEAQAEKFPLQFGKARNVIASTREILEKGTPYHRNLPGKPFTLGEQKGKLLAARREIDNLINFETKAYDNLSTTQKRLVNDLRGELSTALKQGSGGKKLVQADELFSEYKMLEKELFQPFEKLGAGIDVDKTKNLMLRDSGNSRQMKRNLEKMADFLNRNKDELGDIPEFREGRLMVESATELLEQRRILNRMNYATGGPTSQAVLLLANIVQGSSLGTAKWFTLPLMPIINPQGWARIVDHAMESGPMDKRIVQGITTMAQGLKSHYLKDQFKQRQSMKEAEEERRRIQVRKFLGEKR